MIGRFTAQGLPIPEQISNARQKTGRQKLAEKKGADFFLKTVTSAARPAPR